MKKYFLSILLSIVVGIYLGKFMFNQYNNLNLFPVSSEYENIYFIQIGIFDSTETMKETINNLKFYIYSYEKDGIHAYTGMTKSKENAQKIKEFFNQKGYDIIIRENTINNKNFSQVLSQYDLLLNEATNETIEEICNQILSSYEELINNENDGYPKT